MRIVDLRPAPQRWLTARWHRESADGALLARLGARLTDRLVAARVSRRADPPAGVLVVSVGNLRIGGTGKTPVVARLACDLAAAGLRGCVLTRGYGGAAPGPFVVTTGDDSDAAAGDEARLLAAALAPVGWSVIQARRRAAGLDLALAQAPRPAVVLLEDGHQTASVGRHCDVLILDRWTTPARGDGRPAGIRARTGAVLPWGPYRESARGAARADVWLVEAPDPPAPGPEGPPVCGFTRDVAIPLADVPAGAVGLVSGLARPAGFEAMCTRVLGRPPHLSVRCADHCRYDAGLLERVLAAGRSEGVAGWITTEKDWVKLRRRWPASLPLAVARLTVAWTGTPTLPEVILAERRRQGL